MLRNMRSLLLAVLAAVAIPACTDDITGGKGTGTNPGSDTGGDTCTCPDGTIMDGNAGVCASACPAPESGAGTIAIVTDAPTYNTQLMSTVTVNVTVTGSQGFSGLVALTAAITDSTETPITEWMTAFDSAMVSVPMNGSATAKLTVTIPSTATPSLMNKLTITGTPGTTTVTAQAVTAMIAADNTLEIDMSATTMACNFPANADIQVAVGTTINWKNTGTANSFVIHVDNSPTGTGIDHQGETGALDPATTGPGAIWPEKVTAVGSGKVTWHCHLPDDATTQTLTIVMPE
jgi:hypothetical protein